MLDVCQLSFDYHYEPVFKDVSWRLHAGELLHLRGSNGSGKTTLLKVLTGLLMPHSGDVLWEGQSIFRHLRAYQQQLCFVGHKTGLNPILTVRENCQFACQRRSDEMALASFLQYFSLAELEDRPCKQLSQGQQRRVALLRLLMSKAPLWLLDEPFTAIDHLTQARLMKCIEQHLTHGGMVIMTSHQLIPDCSRAIKEFEL